MITDLLIALAAAFAAGLINAVAGGGTLVSFPVLLALGIPPVAANVTNTVALCPGYFGGIFAQRKDFAGQKKRLFAILPVSILGGIAGGLILLNTGEKAFNGIVPYLIILACLLLAIQVPVKKWMQSRSSKTHSNAVKRIGAALLLFLASVYGGYFGAGVSVIVIAILGLIYDDSLTSLNVLKQAISFSINISAAIYFSFSGKVDWIFALVMMLGAVAGGLMGGRFTSRIKPEVLRWIVILVGCTAALIYILK
ncbi:MAG: sulfite exporter TauE/SafE family protein [Bacteroidales bacterium]